MHVPQLILGNSVGNSLRVKANESIDLHEHKKVAFFIFFTILQQIENLSFAP